MTQGEILKEEFAREISRLCDEARIFHVEAKLSHLQLGNTELRRIFCLWKGDSELVPKTVRPRCKDLLESIEPEVFDAQLKNASQLCLSGDDSKLRHFTLGAKRTVMEVGVTAGKHKIYGRVDFRSRKFDDPLFITPFGAIKSYPESDEDTFLSLSHARIAGIRFLNENQEYKIYDFSAVKKLRGYIRWLEEVKPFSDDYKRVRRSLEDSYEIYLQGGWELLNKHYSKENCYLLLRKFMDAGWVLKSGDEGRSITKTATPNSWFAVYII